MSNQTTKQIRLLYGIVTGAVTVIAGICLMAACACIYLGGDHTYSREIVAEAFADIALPVYLCLALVIGGFILDFALPADKKRKAAEKQYALILRQLYLRADLPRCSGELKARLLREQKLRRAHTGISLGLLAAGGILFLSYALNPGNFDSADINGSVVSAVWVLLPCLAVPFVYAVMASVLSKKSLQREIALVKQAPRAAAEGADTPAAKPETGIVLLRCAVLGLGLCFLIFGFLTGGIADVLTKAVNICTECVGLG